MHLEVSPLALPQKLQDFLEFAQEVARRERITSWKLVLWGPPCEAECDDAGKTIYMGTCGTLNLMKQLFLHEVAHALIKPKNQKDRDDSFWHREKWRRNFERLMKKHLPDVKRPDPYIAETAKTRPRRKCRPARRGSAGVWRWRQK
jgi:hypothetical protein